ncbi:translocon-associated protein subunit delta-like [Ascaphus truei]|uniref:translocon-associated protein subunit delta-like n=1 Tax=Ascaphus truei TaxID=8439 RepID=UPI003F59E9F6
MAGSERGVRALRLLLAQHARRATCCAACHVLCVWPFFTVCWRARTTVPCAFRNVALYADVNGKQFPATRGQDIGRYQVSWSVEHKNARSGTYEVKFFDEESYSVLRKAQRNNEDLSAIKPLFTVNVDHRGAWNGPWVSTEVQAALIGILVYYTAYSAKSSIQA